VIRRAGQPAGDRRSLVMVDGLDADAGIPCQLPDGSLRRGLAFATFQTRTPVRVQAVQISLNTRLKFRPSTFSATRAE
jgi:hypothetical protein